MKSKASETIWGEDDNATPLGMTKENMADPIAVVHAGYGMASD